MSVIERDYASFRDPNGYIVYNYDSNTIQRVILPPYYASYATLMKSGLYENLIENNQLINHKLLEESRSRIIIEPQQIPFISYSYEWPFQLLKDAALLTLDIAKKALDYGMCLKDASSYNIQLFNGAPIFIDTLSLDQYQEGKPWGAYGQFCRHFLAPLLFMKYKTLTLSKTLANYIDGFPLDLISSILPFSTHFSPFIKMNIHMHAKRLKQFNVSDVITTPPYMSKKQLMHMFDYMSVFIDSLHHNKEKTEWGNYYTNTNYQTHAFSEKERIVFQLIQRIEAKVLWDAGSNNGHFSRHIAKKATRIIATDIDPVAIDCNYKINKNAQLHSIIPLVIDLTNPSPAIGFDNQERRSFTTRLKEHNIDCTLALALIHHLCLSNNCSFSMVLDYFKKISPYLIIEFVPPEDSWAKTLLDQKREFKHLFDFYNQNNFESVCSEHFDVITKNSIPDSLRTLYLLKRK